MRRPSRDDRPTGAQPAAHAHGSRRAFLAALAGGAGLLAAGALPAAPAGPALGAAAAPRALGVQLHTVRTLMAKDPAGTLAAVARVGYREVEFAGYHDVEPARLREWLDRHGLAAPAAHFDLAELRTRLDPLLDAATTLGHRFLACPWIDERERTPEGIARVAADFTRIGRACRARGVRFAYHNHDFEFAAGVLPGTTIYERLLAETDPAFVDMELDLFWATKGGQDPRALFARHPGRFPLWHVKDMRDVRGRQEMVAVGEGEIDFRGIFAAAAQAGLAHCFVEHDEPVDPLASVRTSYRALRPIAG